MVEGKLDVVVVGGSLAGLLHGVVLKRLGHNVHILERSPTQALQAQGAGIGAMKYVQEFLQTYDATKQPFAIPCSHIQFVNRQTQVVKTQEMALQMTSWDLLYYRLRANFDRLSTEYCQVPPASPSEGNALYDYGRAVTDVRLVNGRVQVAYDDNDGGHGTVDADLVLAADGASSKIRSILEPDIKRTYAGYVAWRGTVPERQASADARETFGNMLTNYQLEAGHILLSVLVPPFVWELLNMLSYVIPGKIGTLEQGDRLLNWVWYCYYDEGSPEFEELMTDTDGQRHRITLPSGKMREAVWSKQKAHAAEVLPAPFADLVSKTTRPFVQTITDVIAPKAAYMEGKVLLVGDALAGFRPHIASSTNQAALNAMLLGQVMEGRLTMAEWEKQCLEYARAVSAQGIAMEDRNRGRASDIVDAVMKRMT
ncbi:MAG: hypothetical protein M1817_004567 [Caeruleum heppii]|nr:MAG: hypothetical protein M1817_004567 [Caeruleum heppii]